MNTSADPIALLGQAAPEFGVAWSVGDRGAHAVMAVFRPSGARVDFNLLVQSVGQVVIVREDPPLRLPTFCPDRHINLGGSFCLGWGPTSPTTVADEASARSYWKAVYDFLDLQVRASESGRWSNGSFDWAHGEAARYQSMAEGIATDLGERFRKDLDERRFEVRLQPHARGTRTHLLRNGTEIACVGAGGRLRDTHRLCPCDASTDRIADCADHALKLAELALAISLWQASERKFLRELIDGGATCCGTIKSCGLRDEAARQKALSFNRRKHVQRHRPRRRPRL